MSLSRRIYISIDSQKIFIDRGLIRTRKTIRFNDIFTVKTIGNDLRIGLKANKEVRINLKPLIIQDIEKMQYSIEQKVNR